MQTYIIIHKHSVQLIELQHGCYEHIHTLNVGWSTVGDLCTHHHIDEKLLHKQELTPLQEQVIYGVMKEFIDPIFQWIATLSCQGPRFLMSDMLQYPLFMQALQHSLTPHDEAFLVPVTHHHKKMFQSPLIEAYLRPLIFGISG